MENRGKEWEMELRVVKFKAAFGEITKEGALYETRHGSWLAYLENEQIADLHFYGEAGWQVFFKSQEFDMADGDELLWLIGVPIMKRLPANNL